MHRVFRPCGFGDAPDNQNSRKILLDMDCWVNNENTSLIYNSEEGLIGSYHERTY